MYERTSGCPPEGCSLSCEGPGAKDSSGAARSACELAANSGASCSRPCMPACTPAPLYRTHARNGCSLQAGMSGKLHARLFPQSRTGVETDWGGLPQVPCSGLQPGWSAGQPASAQERCLTVSSETGSAGLLTSPRDPVLHRLAREGSPWSPAI